MAGMRDGLSLPMHGPENDAIRNGISVQTAKPANQSVHPVELIQKHVKIIINLSKRSSSFQILVLKLSLILIY